MSIGYTYGAIVSLFVRDCRVRQANSNSSKEMRQNARFPASFKVIFLGGGSSQTHLTTDRIPSQSPHDLALPGALIHPSFQ